MLEFLNDNTIQDPDTGIVVQVYINPIALQDYEPYEDFFVTQDFKGKEVMAVWLNYDKNLRAKGDIIINNALAYFIAHNTDKI